jgi:hypothetical protein
LQGIRVGFEVLTGASSATPRRRSAARRG